MVTLGFQGQSNDFIRGLLPPDLGEKPGVVHRYDLVDRVDLVERV